MGIVINIYIYILLATISGCSRKAKLDVVLNSTAPAQCKGLTDDECAEVKSNLDLTMTLASKTSEITNSSLIPVTVTFSSVVKDFEASDITVTNAEVSDFYGSAKDYTFNLKPSHDGNIMVDIAQDVATNIANKKNLAATPLKFIYDGTSPTVSLASSASETTGVSPISVTATFSESVTGFSLADVILSNGIPANLAGSGTTYTFDVTPTAQGTVRIEIPDGGALDAAGNVNTAATQLSRIFDSTSPTVVLSTAVTSSTNSSPFSVTAAFSESVTGFDAGDITVGNGSAGNLTGSGTTYSFDITPTTAGAVTIDISSGVAADVAANANAAATQLTRTYDATSPTVTLSSSAAASINTAFSVTATFSEAVTGFDVSDVTVTNGSASNLAGSGTIYTFDIAPSATGAVNVDIDPSVAADAAGNANIAATQLTRAFDNTAPTVTITSGNSPQTTGTSINVTVTFSEAVTNFVLGDVSVGNGTGGTFTGSGTTYTLVVTPTATGVVTVNVAGSVAIDAVGNQNTAATQLSVVYEPVLPDLTTTYSTLYAKTSEAVSFNLTTSGGTAPYTYSLPTNPSSFGSIDSSGVFQVNASSAGDLSFTARVTDTYGATDDLTFTVTVRAYRTCVWTGTSSVVFETSANWIFCNGAVPSTTDWIAVPSAPANQPTVASSRSILGVAVSAYSGGTLTINAGINLRLQTTTPYISSSIKLKGATVTCTTCVLSFDANLIVNTGATLTLDSGILLRANSNSSIIYFGDLSTNGNFVSNIASADPTQWPTIEGQGGSVFGGLTFRGVPSSSKSEATINGLNFSDAMENNITINFLNDWKINQLDNLTITSSASTGQRTGKGIVLTGCTGGQTVDTEWSGIVFTDPIHTHFDSGQNNANIHATGCTGIGPITVTGSGLGFGASFENDPNNLIAWTNGDSYSCIWNGSTSTSWTDPANWSSCTNGRSNYPDANDQVIVNPLGGAVLFQPIVSDTIRYIRGIAAGTGGGTITVAANSNLFLLVGGYLTAGIRSNITFVGDTTTCTTCIVSHRDFAAVTNNATLTLGKGIAFNVSGNTANSWFYVGRTNSAGHFSAQGGIDPNEWPVVGAPGASVRDGLNINGTSSVLSSVNIDGLKVKNIGITGGVIPIQFGDYYRVTKMDNLSVDFTGAPPVAAIQFNYCHTATNRTMFDDATWTNLSFVKAMGTGGKNVFMNHANCTSANGYNITVLNDTLTAGWGSAFEGDAGGAVTWTP